jgi:Phage integrase family
MIGDDDLGLAPDELAPCGHVDGPLGVVALESGRVDIPLTDGAEALLGGLSAPEDRIPGELVMPTFRVSTFRQALERACKSAGTLHYHPHDLRHRFISLLVLAGVPMPLVREIAGHKKGSITQDTYSHVLLDEPQQRLEELRQAVGRASRLVVDPETTEVKSV